MGIKELAIRDTAIRHEEALEGVQGDHPLTVYRRKRGWTMKKFAEEAGISLAMVSKVERGERGWNHELVSRAAAKLGCTVEELMDAGYVAVPVPRAVPVVSLAEALAVDGGRGIAAKEDRQYVAAMAMPGAKVVAVQLKEGEFAGFIGIVACDAKEGEGTFIRMDEEVQISIGEGVPEGSYAIGKIISVLKAI